MKLSTEPILLHPEHPFVTSKDRTLMSESVLVRIEHHGVVGWGEAKVTPDSCGGSGEAVCDLAAEAEPLLGDDPFLLEDVLDRVAAELPHACCTLAGIDIALHDLCGKLLGSPLYRLFGLNPERTPKTSFTLGIDERSVVFDELRQARAHPILKIKVGFPGDVSLFASVEKELSSVRPGQHM